MCLFLESIRIERGKAWHLDFHQRRVDDTLRRFFPARSLSLRALLPQELPRERSKWRIVYGATVEEMSLTPYVPRLVRSLRLVAITADYPYKALDRRALDAGFEQRGEADDVLFVRNGWLTDTSICNIALSDGAQWVTPSAPLLRGTTRERLLSEGLLREAPLRVEDLSHFSHIALFNAMLPFGSLVLPVAAIHR